MNEELKHTEDLQEETQQETIVDKEEQQLPIDENLSSEQINNISSQEEIAMIDKLQTELHEYKDKYLRLFAEFDNFKKRNAKERRDLILTAGQDIIKELLPILDDYKRANKTYIQDNNVENFANGLQLIFDKFQKTLQQKGLKEVESTGKDFDIEQHEAIAEIPATSEELKGKIIDEVESGYTLNNIIIRYAKVVVGK